MTDVQNCCPRQYKNLTSVVQMENSERQEIDLKKLKARKTMDHTGKKNQDNSASSNQLKF